MSSWGRVAVPDEGIEDELLMAATVEPTLETSPRGPREVKREAQLEES